MLNGISKLLTGDMLKALCDMGHGDVLVIADANFPGERLAAETTFGRLIRCPGTDVAQVFAAICGLFPLDTAYTEHPASVMELTDGDKARNIPQPEAWADYEKILRNIYPEQRLGRMERFQFYERTRQAYAIIQTGEERQYGNLMLVKGCVL